MKKSFWFVAFVALSFILFSCQQPVETPAIPAAEYKVEVKLQNIEQNDFVSAPNLSFTGKGNVGETVDLISLLTQKCPVGFEVNEESNKSLTITEGGTASATFKYNRKQITLTFDTDGGSEVSSISGIYEKEITAPSELTKQGYSFKEWQPALPEKFPAEDTTYKAIWKGEEVNYTAKYFLQNLSQTGYEEQSNDLEILQEEVNKPVTSTQKKYLGFTFEKIEGEPLKADGSSEVKVYFTRNIINLNFNSNGGSTVNNISGLYGAEISNPDNPTKTGYNFTEWQPSLPQKFPAENSSYTAQWQAENFNIAYYDGENQINDIGKTTYTIEEDFTLPTPTKAGYIFEGWFTDKNFVNSATSIAKGSFDSKIFYAKFRENSSFLDIQITAPQENDIKVTTSSLDAVSVDDEITFAIENSSNFANFNWKISKQGKEVASGTQSTFSWNAQKGTYSIYLRAQDTDGNYYSYSADVVIK